MNKFFLIPLLFLASCGDAPEIIPVAIPFEKTGYNEMLDLMDKWEERNIYIDEDPPVALQWHGIPIQKVCVATVDDGLRFHTPGVTTMVPLGTGQYAFIVTTGFDEEQIFVSSIYGVSGSEYPRWVQDRNWVDPIQLVYKPCGES